MNWQFVEMLKDSKFQSKPRVLDMYRWCKTKLLCFLFGEICVVLFHGFLFFCSFVLCHLCLLHKIIAQTPITAILFTYLIHEFLVNAKCRMDGNPTDICLSCNFLIQYSASETCLTSVNMQEYVTSPWLLWQSYIFPDLYGNSWLVKLSLMGNRIHFPGMVTHVTQ